MIHHRYDSPLLHGYDLPLPHGYDSPPVWFTTTTRLRFATPTRLWFITPLGYDSPPLWFTTPTQKLFSIGAQKFSFCRSNRTNLKSGPEREQGVHEVPRVHPRSMHVDVEHQRSVVDVLHDRSIMLQNNNDIRPSHVNDVAWMIIARCHIDDVTSKQMNVKWSIITSPIWYLSWEWC